MHTCCCFIQVKNLGYRFKKNIDDALVFILLSSTKVTEKKLMKQKSDIKKFPFCLYFVFHYDPYDLL